ncbi:MAG: bifunctional diguanylate cyclase/phosphodiesterase [Bacillota bacterium]
MSLHNETNDSNVIAKLFEIRAKFIEADDINAGYSELMKNMIDYFDFDRIYVGMKSFSKSQCIPVIEYFKNKPHRLLSNRAEFNEYTKFTNVEIDEIEQEYIGLADTNNYFLGDEFQKLSHMLSHLSYVPSEIGNPKECLIFYMKTEDVFSFVFMERYDGRETTFSELEKMAITDTFHLLRIKVATDILLQRAYNEAHMNHAMLQNENMPMCLVSKKDRKVVYFNENYKKLIPTARVGVKYNEIFVDVNHLGKDYNTKLTANSEELIRHKRGKGEEETITYLIKKVIPLTLVDGLQVYMIYVKDTLDYIRQLEGVDLLTSAYSEKGFSSYFKNNIKNQFEKEYMLCTLDVAKFKFINDTKGFTVGNHLLRKISKVLRDFVRTQELFCRLNGDKFAILLQCDTKDEVRARIKGLFSKLEIMRTEEFPDIGITYVCGIVNVEEGVEINALIDKANISRKIAKGSHENVISFFDEEMERKLLNEVNIEARISKAVEDGEFIPYLQPKFNLETMEICGAEALVRWVTPAGMIFPDNFIPLFEKNGFITTLDFIIYRKVMMHIRECLDKKLPIYPISVNVSRNHIRNENFANQMMDLINEFGIPIELLELEITESVFVEDREVLKFFVDNINHIRVKVSIDDFGSAYSSLQILKDVNMDILKIDKGFLDNIGVDNQFTKDELVLKNIINLAKDLKCKVVCEGVETEHQVEVLKNIGCEVGQGYVFARPMPIEEYCEKYLLEKKMNSYTID